MSTVMIKFEIILNCVKMLHGIKIYPERPMLLRTESCDPTDIQY
jgi:hypothetical protein